MRNMNLELTQGQADLLYNSLSALCLQYEEVIEKADTASKKKLYQNYREKTLEIIRQIERQRVDEEPRITGSEDQ